MKSYQRVKGLPSVDNGIHFILETPTNPTPTSSNEKDDILNGMIFAGVDVQSRFEHAVEPAANGEMPLMVVLPSLTVPTSTTTESERAPKMKSNSLYDPSMLPDPRNLVLLHLQRRTDLFREVFETKRTQVVRVCRVVEDMDW